VRTATPKRRFVAFNTTWADAPPLVGAESSRNGGLAGKIHDGHGPGFDRTVVFNLPSVSRGADDCTAVRLAIRHELQSSVWCRGYHEIFM